MWHLGRSVLLQYLRISSIVQNSHTHLARQRHETKRAHKLHPLESRGPHFAGMDEVLIAQPKNTIAIHCRPKHHTFEKIRNSHVTHKNPSAIVATKSSTFLCHAGSFPSCRQPQHQRNNIYRVAQRLQGRASFWPRPPTWASTFSCQCQEYCRWEGGGGT